MLLYKHRWDTETYFRWIKGHLRIKHFWGTSENAVKTQIYVGLITFLLTVQVKYYYNIEYTLHEISQIISRSLFEKISISELNS